MARSGEPVAGPGRRILINGKFLAAPATGVQRVARELIRALDSDLSENPSAVGWEILAPENADHSFSLANISLRDIGGKGGAAWEQTSLPRAANGGLLVSLANSAPILHRRGVVMLHDAQVFDAPESYSPAFRAWYRFLHPLLARRSSAVLTVSDFSRSRLAANGVTQSAHVVPNGFDHILRVEASPDALSRHGLVSGGYVLAFASRQPHKNTGLLLDLFSSPRSDGVVLALVGDALPGDARLPGDHVRLLGRVPDSDLKALYSGAAAFLSPSLTEGFGLPAGEAALCGTAVLVARAGAQTEIWNSSGLCEAPDDQESWRRRLDALLRDPAVRMATSQVARSVALRYTWRNAARLLRSIVDPLA